MKNFVVLFVALMLLTVPALTGSSQAQESSKQTVISEQVAPVPGQLGNRECMENIEDLKTMERLEQLERRSGKSLERLE